MVAQGNSACCVQPPQRSPVTKGTPTHGIVSCLPTLNCASTTLALRNESIRLPNLIHQGEAPTRKCSDLVRRSVPFTAAYDPAEQGQTRFRPFWGASQSWIPSTLNSYPNSSATSLPNAISSPLKGSLEMYADSMGMGSPSSVANQPTSPRTSLSIRRALNDQKRSS